MQLFDDCVCGTTSTGTGTLTLAASPVSGVDPDVWARAVGFGNSAAILVSAVVTEYTDATFTIEKQKEKGVYTLTLGSSSGIANCTLARTQLNYKGTSLNVQPATAALNPATGISIGTAANVLIFIAPSVTEDVVFSPFVNNTGGQASTNGFPPLINATVATGGGANLVNNQDWTANFIWPYNMLVKRIFVRVESNYTGAVSNLYARIYDVNSGGLAGKLLYDFGVLGTANSSFNVANFTVISSGASGNGLFLTPGDYFLQFCPIWTVGGTGTPQLTIWAGGTGPIVPGRMGLTGGVQAFSVFYDNSANATAPDPAPTPLGPISSYPVFYLAPS